jgi:hypothetical protein
MNAAVFQVISIVAFSLAGVLAAVAVFLFFKLDVRAVIDDLSGKKAERQIRELRAQNLKVETNRNGRILYDRSTGDGKTARTQEESTAKLDTGKLSHVFGTHAKRTAPQPVPAAEEGTSLLEEEGTSLLEEEGTSLLEEEGTALLAEEGTTLLEGEGTTLLGGDGTTLADDEGTTVLASSRVGSPDEEGTTVLMQNNTELSGGYRLLLEEIIIHTDERV